MDCPNIDIDFSSHPGLWTEYHLKFKRFIAQDVIKYLSPQISQNDGQNNDIQNNGSEVLESLEKYIFDNDINQLNQPTRLCRRALKPGDVIFSCNDCGLDATCVVCIDCFHKSAHKDHNYRMANSEGGGCCDCGDVEAWTQHYACTDHLNLNQANLTLADFQDRPARARQIQEDKKNCLQKVNQLPKKIASKYFFVCQAALFYAHEMLTWEEETILPSGLGDDIASQESNSPSGPETTNNAGERVAPQGANITVDASNYFTVLFNDEVHTYDHVINTLVKVIKCTKKTASKMASTVSREGRSLIINDNYEACRKVKDSIANVRDAGQNPLKVKIIHKSILAHQAFALKLIEWIQKMSSLCDALRIITAHCLYSPSDNLSDKTLVESIMISNTNYWKIARIEWNDLFVAALLTEYSIKEQFARYITRNYPKLMDCFVQDDHDHSVSILTMTTQLYTVPSLICMLIEDEDALTILSKTLLHTYQKTKRENQSNSYENRQTFDMQGLKRGFYTINDLKYLVNIQPTKWTDQLRANVVSGVKTFLNLLNIMQGMDSVKRQMGQHLEYEPDWESGMTLQQRLVDYITRLVTYCSFDEEVLVSTLKETQVRLAKTGCYKMNTKELFGHQVSCVQYDVATSPVSVHLPLTRFAAALILQLMQIKPSNEIPYNESLVILSNSEQTMIDIMEPSLRTQVMIAQFRSGMWRRNGYSLVNQIAYFHGPMMRREMFDRDILLLQETAAMCDANHFMIHLLNKYQLFTWISSETTREPLVGPRAVSFHNDEDMMTQTMSLGEEFLQLLLSIISERYYPGVGQVTEEDVIKNEIIQLLCISPLTRSDLTQKLHLPDKELDCIKSVAILKRTSESTTGKYELKNEYYDRFNPFFYHYSRRNQSNALDAQLKRKKNLKENLICCPPPKPVELTKQFSNLNELLKCDITLTLIQKILVRALGVPEGSLECSTKAPIRFLASDLQLDQSLHLIGLGLHEQERNPVEFCFLQEAHKKGIFESMKDCYEKAKRSKDLIIWLMKKTDQLIDNISENHGPSPTLKSIKECFGPILAACESIKPGNKKRNSQLASQLQDRIMAMMKANQDKFMANPKTKQLAEETAKNDSTEEPPTGSCNSIPTSHLCILCRDEQRVGFDQPTMVLLAYIQRSATLSKNRNERRIPNYALTPSNQLKYQALYQSRAKQGTTPIAYSFTSDNSWSFDATFMPSDLFFGPHISTCGHAMHFNCWNGFFQTIMRRETTRPNRNTRHVSYELEKFEILCPLCECISNATIPLMPNWTNFAKRTEGLSIFNASDSILAKSSENLSAFLLVLRGTVDTLKHVRFSKPNKKMSSEDKYMRLLQPKNHNDVLEDLGEKEALSLRDFINSLMTSACGVSTQPSPNKSLLDSIKGFADRIHTVGLDLDRNLGDIQDARIFMMTSWSVSYTIQTYERVARFKGSPIFEDIDFSKNLCIASLLRFACASTMVHHPDMMRDLLVRKLRYLLINDEHLSSSPSILDIDAFELFVSLFILLQQLYDLEEYDECITRTGKCPKAFDHEYFRNLLHLMVILNMLQVCISIQNDSRPLQQPIFEATTSEACSLMNFFKDIIVASGHPNSKVPAATPQFVVKFKRDMLPFLRSCAVFFFHLSNIKPPKVLREQSAFHEGKNFSNHKVDETMGPDKGTEDEFDAICSYLDLPSELSKLVQSQEACHLACSWLRHSRVLLLIEATVQQTPSQPHSSELMPLKFIRQPHAVNRLVDLPLDYSELADKVSVFSCPSFKNEDSRTPTMCLVCGVMLCSQSYCCQRDLNDLASNYQKMVQLQQEASAARVSTLNFLDSPGLLFPAPNPSPNIAPPNIAVSSSVINQQLVGSCTYHAYECSGGVGVFLRIRNCQILLLSGRSKGCYMPAPYIDDHGETDFGLIRGNPLYLNRQHYEKIQHMWLSHTIPEQISRTLEYSPYFSSVNWYLH